MHTRAVIFTLYALISLFPIKSRSQQLQPLTAYEKSLKEFYYKQRTAERSEFQEFKEKPLWRYLPDVGLQFGLPSIQFRLSNYFEYKRDQHLQWVKLKSIDEKMQLEMNDKIQELRIAYQKQELDQQKLEVMRGRLTYLERLHQIETECCERRECTPEECVKSEMAFYQATEAVRMKELDVKTGILELQRMAKYELPDFNFFR